MPSVMTDSREPVPTTLGFAISRWGRPGELAATGARYRKRCRIMTRACQGINTSFPDAPDVLLPRPPTRVRCVDRPGARY